VQAGEHLSERKQGASIKPEDVKVGDKIGVTLVKKSITKTFTGEVDSIKTDPYDNEYRIIYTTGEALWSHFWVEYKTDIVLLKAAPEPHALDDAEVGDTFDISLYSREWHYTKIRDGFWVFEITDTGSDNLKSVERISEEKARRHFENYDTKLVKLER
jgi:hypothetical protein